MHPVMIRLDGAEFEALEKVRRTLEASFRAIDPTVKITPAKALKFIFNTHFSASPRVTSSSPKKKD